MLVSDQTIAERYQLTSRLAAGGMGEVWRARDDRLQRDVAVKILHAVHADDEAFRARFKAEARSAASLKCEQVVDVYDWGEQKEPDGSWLSYIVMEFVDGQTLADVIGRDGVLDPALTAGVIADTASGLAAAHQVGLVHRDVKPANLLVTVDGRLKVADFGIARAKDSLSLTATGTLIGTATYLSPEQVRGQPATAASDIYSLGVVAYQCLSGQPPFRGDGEIATAVARLAAPMPVLPVTVPRQLGDLVLAMLDPDPTLRPTAAAVARIAGELATSVAAGSATHADAVTLVMPVAASTAAVTRIQPVAAPASRRWPTRPLSVAAGVAALVLTAIVVSLLAIDGSGDGKTPTPRASKPTVSHSTPASTPSQPPVATTQPVATAKKPGKGKGPGPGGPGGPGPGKGRGHGHGPGGPPGHDKGN